MQRVFLTGRRVSARRRVQVGRCQERVGEYQGQDGEILEECSDDVSITSVLPVF